MQAHKQTPIYTEINPSKVWEQFADDIYSIRKGTQLGNFFYHINSLHQNIKFTIDEESMENQWFLTLIMEILKRNNEKISILEYRKPTHTAQYLHCSSHHQTSCKKSVFSSFSSRPSFIITNKGDLTNNNSLSQSQQKIQATDIQELSQIIFLFLIYVTPYIQVSNFFLGSINIQF